MALFDRELHRWLEHSPIGIYRCNEAGTFHYVNMALVRLLDYDTADELLARNLNRDIFVDPDERVRLIARYRPEGRVVGARALWKTKHGRQVTVQLYGHLIEEPDGTSFDASVLDVTALEVANTELSKQREDLATTGAMLDLVVQQMTAVYWTVDRNLRYGQSGGATRELFGVPPGMTNGMTVDEAARIYPHLHGGPIDTVALHRRALAGETVTFVTETLDKHLAITVCPQRSSGVVVGAIGTCVDVTSRYTLERHIVDAQRAESLGVLAAGLAHDFNNLLAVILGNADLALREVPPHGPGRMPLENIRQASLRAAELTAQLLAYAGRGGVAATRVSPSPVVEELLRMTAPTLPVNVSVCVDIDRDLVLRGDPSQIRQVMLNLLNNARDALGARGGTIAITGILFHHDGVAHAYDVVTAPAGTYVELEVADDGPGMDRETRRRIFEPFFTTKSTGHGLGLAAVVGIVRAHGGGLRVDTAPGSGARFQILWPSTFTPTEFAAVRAPAANHTVLLINDEDLVRDAVRRMIETLGYAAISVTDGTAGLEIVDHIPVDAVLVDLTAPQTTGPEVVTALRKRRPTLPIILCSSLDRDGYTGHADAFLSKPFQIDKLEQTLAKLLPRDADAR